MYKDNYIYPCVFIYENDGIAVYYPDLDGCITFGNNEQEAFKNAKEALTMHLYGIEQDNDPVPQPSLIKDIDFESHEQVLLLEVPMLAFRAKQANKLVKKTLTIPEWLNIVAENNNVNFSQLLQSALKQHLQLEA